MTTVGVPAPAGPVSEEAAVTDTSNPDEQMASSEQLDELRRLASAAGEEVPDTLRAAEAAQRKTELGAASGS